MIKVKDYMKELVFTLSQECTLEDAINLIIEQKKATLPVVDKTGHVKGILYIRDILKIVLPDFFSIVKNLDFIKDYGSFDEEVLRSGVEQSKNLKVIDFMQKEFYYLDPEDSLLRAMAIFLKHSEITDLLVLKDGKIRGVISVSSVANGIFKYIKNKTIDNQEE